MLTRTRIGLRQRVAIVAAVISFGAATFAQAHSFPRQTQTVSMPDTVLECHHQYGASYMRFCVNSTKANSPEKRDIYKNQKSKIKELFIVIGPATPLVGS